ncbi:MAG: MotA/TolQ/ExbB proton channel family protein [Pseudomonadota bacterium]
MKILVSILLLTALFLLISTFSFTIDNLENLNIENKKLQAQFDQLQINRWQDKKKSVDYKEETSDELEKLEDNLTMLINEKNRLEENYAKLQIDISQSNEELREIEESAKLVLLDEKQRIQTIKSELKLSFPIKINERMIAYSEIEKFIEESKQNADTIITEAGDRIIKQETAEIDEANKAVLFKDNLLHNNNLIGGRKIRLGNIFLGFVSKDFKEVFLVLRTGKASGETYSFRSDIASSSKDALITLMSRIDSNEKGLSSLPFDATQKKAVGLGFTTEGNVGFIEQAKRFLFSGGPIMYPLLLIALIALIFVIERYFYLILNNSNQVKIIDGIMTHVRNKDIDRTIKYLKTKEGILAKFLISIIDDNEALNNINKMEKKIEEKASIYISKLEKRLSTLSVLGTIAPLLGLLGTVAGMISLFEVITSYGTSDPKLLAGGISEALITTETGLIIAIPIILAHNFLSNKADKIINDIHVSAMAILGVFKK